MSQGNSRSFKDWIMDQETRANEENDMERNIDLESKIDDEMNKQKPRRSLRVAFMKRAKEINIAYNAYLESIEKQAELEKK